MRSELDKYFKLSVLVYDESQLKLGLKNPFESPTPNLRPY